MKENKIQLLNTLNQPVYKKQISEAAQMVNDSEIIYDGEEESVSPVRQTMTKLDMQDKDLQNIELEVRDFIRRNSQMPVNV